MLSLYVFKEGTHTQTQNFLKNYLVIVTATDIFHFSLVYTHSTKTHKK